MSEFRANLDSFNVCLSHAWERLGEGVPVLSVLALFSILITACSPASSATRPAGDTGAQAGNADANRTLVFATRHEPVYIAKRGLQSTAPGSTGPTVFDAGLAMSAG